MKRVLVFSCDAKFYEHARELIASVRRTSPGVVDQFVFFDLGLRPEQRANLEATVVDYPVELKAFYPDFLTPRMFAWKCYVLAEAAKLGDAILYADCGCVALNNIAPLFDAIERDGVLMVKDDHRNDERTHEACLRIMNATASERTATQIDAGMIGYTAHGPYARIFSEAFTFAQQRDCIFGDAREHRHDQSIYSILAARYGVPVMHPYGRYLHWRGIESRDQIIWQHRGKWPAFKGLIARAAAAKPSRVAIYGAGQHTNRFISTFRSVLEPRHTIVGVLDDSPKAATFGDLPLLPTTTLADLRPDVVLLSSDAHEEAMRSRIQGVDLWPLYTA